MIKFSGKIPVTIYPLFWLIVIFISWINALNFIEGAIWLAVITTSVLIHEFGHALTALAFGQTAKIDLVAFGGVTHRTGGKKIKSWQEFVIVLNGPLAGFTLSFFAWLLQGYLLKTSPNSLLLYAAIITCYVNLFWTLLNLLPVQPLDGGKLLSLFLEGVFGLKGKKIALFISLLFAAGFGVVFLCLQEFLISSFFLIFAFESFRAWKQSLLIKEVDQDFILQHELAKARQKLAEGNKLEALNQFQRLRDLTQEGVIYITSTEMAANILADIGEVKQARELLCSIEKKLSLEGISLLHRLHYLNGNWKLAIIIGRHAYHQEKNKDKALINAYCHASLGEVKQAIGWLYSAINEGEQNLKEILDKKDFDVIRKNPLFQEFRKNNIKESSL